MPRPAFHLPIRKYVLPILLQPFPQYQMSRKEIREYITSNADEDGNLWCYLTVRFNKHKQIRGKTILHKLIKPWERRIMISTLSSQLGQAVIWRLKETSEWVIHSHLVIFPVPPVWQQELHRGIFLLPY